MSVGGRFAGLGIVVALIGGLGATGTFVLGRSYSELARSSEPFDRNQYVPSFDPIEDASLGVSPNSGDLVESKVDPSIHAIAVYPTQTILLAGGQAVRTLDVPAPTTLSGLTRLVRDPAWLSESGTVITLRAAVILQHGAAMSVAQPTTTELVMKVKPCVFLAANAASTLNIAGVYVHASDSNTPTTSVDPQSSAGRPFVLAVADSVMNVTNSRFRYLGRDWNTSYGLSWSKGAKGSVTDSVFEHNFIGVYSNGSPSLTVMHNQFYNNSLYGVDPHSGSAHQDVEYNVADFNGRHGIIFSDHVTQSVVAHNTTEGNGLNGIMMDEESTGNRVFDNTVKDNKSDGIVLASSSQTLVDGNTITGNRVGLVLRGTTARSRVTNNTIAHNKLAIQGGRISSGHNHLANNGGEWSSARISLVWLGSAALLVLLGGATGISNVRTRRYRAKHAPTELSLV
jgi:poly(beta-D-mannuronate) C5 epimerase